ncbi:hypothetical protein BX666DRAFT_1232539 [Dichotomocladium elegans]|nr:hypothetical protein BX666DRAFT_1232539 [Dichotomocladium elegans]
MCSCLLELLFPMYAQGRILTKNENEPINQCIFPHSLHNRIPSQSRIVLSRNTAFLRLAFQWHPDSGERFLGATCYSVPENDECTIQGRDLFAHAKLTLKEAKRWSDGFIFCGGVNISGTQPTNSVIFIDHNNGSLNHGNGDETCCREDLVFQPAGWHQSLLDLNP